MAGPEAPAKGLVLAPVRFPVAKSESAPHVAAWPAVAAVEVAAEARLSSGAIAEAVEELLRFNEVVIAVIENVVVVGVIRVVEDGVATTTPAALPNPTEKSGSGVLRLSGKPADDSARKMSSTATLRISNDREDDDAGVDRPRPFHRLRRILRCRLATLTMMMTTTTIGPEAEVNLVTRGAI